MFVNWGVALFLLVQASFLRKTIMEAHIFQEDVRFQDFPTERDGTFWNDPWVWVISIHNLPSCEVTYPLPRHFWVDDVPFPKVGFVSSLEGNSNDVVSASEKASPIPEAKMPSPLITPQRRSSLPLCLRPFFCNWVVGPSAPWAWSKAAMLGGPTSVLWKRCLACANVTLKAWTSRNNQTVNWTDRQASNKATHQTMNQLFKELIYWLIHWLFDWPME